MIVSYNVRDLLKNCLDSVVNFSKDVGYEIIVVDNASTDGSVEMLKSYKGIRTIFPRENLGFSKGNNLGMGQAKGKYVFFLNPDTLFVENTLKTLFDWMEGHTDVAVASCQLLDFEQKVSSTGGYFPTLLRVLLWALFLDDLPFIADIFKSYHPYMGPFNKRKVIYQKEFFPDWVTGACFFVRKEAADRVGGFDENLFMYGEELEWCMRFKMALRPGSGQAAWRVGYTPTTKIIHLERRSSGGLPRNAVLGEFRGLKYIYGKHFPGWKQIVLGLLLDVAAFDRVVFWLVRRNLAMVRVYLEALAL